MNSLDNEHNERPTAGETPGDGIPTDRRPLGYWLRAVDGLLTSAFAEAFAEEHIDRRDWMLLNALSGDVEPPAFAAKLARRGKRLRSLAERGWIAEQDGEWALTDEGRAAKERLSALVEDIRDRVAGAVSPEEYATTMTSLEVIAREFGWDESDAGRRGSRHGFGRFGRGRGFGPGHGFGHGDGFGPGHGAGHSRESGHGRPGFHGRPDFGPADGPREHCHPHHRRHHGEGERHGAERAYERGFDAGFARGRGTSDVA